MLALDAVDQPLADMLGVDHVRDQLVIDVGDRRSAPGIGSKHVARTVDERIDRAAPSICANALVLAEDGQRLAVEDELDVGIAAGAGGGSCRDGATATGQSW